jgi:peroxiredoxin
MMTKTMLALMAGIVVFAAGCSPRPQPEGKAASPVASTAAPSKAATQPTPAAAGGAKPQDVSAVKIHLASGQTKTISDYAGKIVVLDFWATYCKTCIERLPGLEKTAAEWGPGVVVIAVSFDPDVTTATGWAKAHKMGLPIAKCDDAMMDVFFPGEDNVPIPQTRVIDATGKIAKAWGPDGTEDELAQEVQTLLGGGGKAKG